MIVQYSGKKALNKHNKQLTQNIIFEGNVMNRIIQYAKLSGIVGLSVLLVLIAILPSELKAFQLEDLASNNFDSLNQIEVHRDGDKPLLVTLKVKNMKLSEVLNDLTRQANVGISYDSEIDIERSVTIGAKNKPFFTLLDSLLKDSNLEYSISEDQRVLVVKQKQENSQLEDIQEEITGRIIDSQTGEPLPGVNILLRGTSTGTSTDGDGNFKIDVPDLEQVLIITYIGYLRMEVPIEGRTELEIELVPGIISGDELVVIGYGQQRQRDLTGSVSTINAADLGNQSVTSPEQLLQGKIPGVQLTNSSGQPGSATNILIRGGSSINAGNLPLFVIDGVPINMMADETSSGILSGTPISPLASINPNDIESISVLKDASATAIYGARGAGGVILVTTKRGVAGQAQVSYSGSYGVQNTPEKYSVLNATEYANLRNEALTNDGLPPIYTEQEINSFGEGTDWQDEIFQTGSVQEHHLSISGGNETTQYYVSGGYNFFNGTVIESDFENLNLRVNLNTDISEKIRIGNNFTASRINSNIIKTSENTRGSGADVILASLIFNPTTPVRAEDGSYNLINEPGGQPNPVATAREEINETERYNYVNNFFGEVDIANGLRFRSDFGVSINNSRENFFRPDFIQIVTPLNEASVASLNRTNWVSNNILRYETEFETFGSLQYVDVTLGISRENTSREILRAGAQGFPTNDLRYYSLSAGEQFSIPGTIDESSDLISYLGRVNYRLKDRYLITFSGRIDGSSRFGAGNKYGFFPSGALAWNMAEESFIRDLNLVSELKLRLSYGVTGNQEIGNYRSLSLMGTRTSVLGERVQNVVFPINISNPDLKWETSGQFNVGLDVETLRNKLSFTADYYNKKTTDLLLNIPLPYTSGFNQSTINLGDIRNKGVEFGVQVNNLNTGSFSMNAGFNIAFNENQILSIGELEPFFAGGESQTAGVDSRLIIQEGLPVGSFYGLKSGGIFQNEQEIANSAQPDALPGDEIFLDINNDGVINADDRSVIGSAQPDFTGGFSSNIFYKNFELAANINFVYGNQIFNGNRFELERTDGTKNANRAVLDRWTPNNPDASVPRASRTSQQTFSDRFLEDGSYIRLQSLSLGYNIPGNVLSGLNMRNLRLYVRGENLFVITNYSGFDPEVSSFGQDFLTQGFDLGVYPKSRLFTAGLEINF